VEGPGTAIGRLREALERCVTQAYLCRCGVSDSSGEVCLNVDEGSPSEIPSRWLYRATATRESEPADSVICMGRPWMISSRPSLSGHSCLTRGVTAGTRGISHQSARPPARSLRLRRVIVAPLGLAPLAIQAADGNAPPRAFPTARVTR
jgi:hypothetical protein